MKRRISSQWGWQNYIWPTTRLCILSIMSHSFTVLYYGSATLTTDLFNYFLITLTTIFFLAVRKKQRRLRKLLRKKERRRAVNNHLAARKGIGNYSYRIYAIFQMEASLMSSTWIRIWFYPPCRRYDSDTPYDNEGNCGVNMRRESNRPKHRHEHRASTARGARQISTSRCFSKLSKREYSCLYCFPMVFLFTPPLLLRDINTCKP